MRRAKFSWLLGIAVVSAAGCGGGQYGYAREYVPLSAEDDYLDRAQHISFEEVRRRPSEFQSTLLEWFGVVTQVAPAQGGQRLVELSFRTHQARHLCRDETSGSCRVTVSESDGGSFRALLPERLEDPPITRGSLIRIYGHPSAETTEAGPLLRAEWYRHWPLNTYVTTGDAAIMRR